MPKVEFKGDTWMVDDDGFIDAFENWSENWVEYVAESEGITEMTEDHWKVVNYLQEYYKEYGIAPMI